MLFDGCYQFDKLSLLTFRLRSFDDWHLFSTVGCGYFARLSALTASLPTRLSPLGGNRCGLFVSLSVSSRGDSLLSFSALFQKILAFDFGQMATAVWLPFVCFLFQLGSAAFACSQTDFCVGPVWGSSADFNAVPLFGVSFTFFPNWPISCDDDDVPSEHCLDIYFLSSAFSASSQSSRAF